jgi:hypothetical protein
MERVQNIIYVVTWRLKSGIVESEYTFITRQRLGKQVPAATYTHATIEVLLETMFSTRSVPRSYQKDNWDNQVNSGQDSEEKSQWQLSRQLKVNLWRKD